MAIPALPGEARILGRARTCAVMARYARSTGPDSRRDQLSARTFTVRTFPFPNRVDGDGVRSVAACAGSGGQPDEAYLGVTAEDRMHAAEPPELTIVAEQRTGAPASQGGPMWSARAAAFARCDLGGDHAPWDRLAALQLPQPRRGPDDHAGPAAADISTAGADVDSIVSSSRHSCQESS